MQNKRLAKSILHLRLYYKDFLKKCSCLNYSKVKSKHKVLNFKILENITKSMFKKLEMIFIAICIPSFVLTASCRQTDASSVTSSHIAWNIKIYSKSLYKKRDTNRKNQIQQKKSFIHERMHERLPFVKGGMLPTARVLVLQSTACRALDQTKTHTYV